MTIIINTSPTQKQKEILGKFFKQKRLETKKNVPQLALLISRSTNYYYKLEWGEVSLDAKVIRRLFDAYNVDYAKAT